MNKQFISNLVRVTLLAMIAGSAALAQGTNKTTYDPDGGFGTGAGYAPDNGQVGGQTLDSPGGDMFMEEVLPGGAKPKPKPKLIPIDLSRVGVSVDPHGNIVPLRDDPAAPWAGSGVKPFYNKVETSTTLPYVVPNYPYAPPFVAPYGYGAPFGGYPGYPAPVFGFPGYGSGYGSPYGYGSPLGFGTPFPFGAPDRGGAPYSSVYPYSSGNPYGFGAPNAYGGGIGGSLRAALPAILGAASNAFNGYPPYYYPYYGNPYYSGYSPYSVGYMTTGNSATFLSNDPVTGAPLPQGQNNVTNFSSGKATFAPGPWWPTTNYSQNSMWKAFNLAF